MKKIIISILIVLVLITSTTIITYKLIPYSFDDADRVKKIVLGNIKPTPLDYIRLDINHDRKINMLDALLIVKKVIGEK